MRRYGFPRRVRVREQTGGIRPVMAGSCCLWDHAHRGLHGDRSPGPAPGPHPEHSRGAAATRRRTAPRFLVARGGRRPGKKASGASLRVPGLVPGRSPRGKAVGVDSSPSEEPRDCTAPPSFRPITGHSGIAPINRHRDETGTVAHRPGPADRPAAAASGPGRAAADRR